MVFGLQRPQPFVIDGRVLQITQTFRVVVCVDVPGFEASLEFGHAPCIEDLGQAALEPGHASRCGMLRVVLAALVNGMTMGGASCTTGL